MSSKIPLIIPVENQVRELDPKVLLACIAARHGFTSVIGSHRIIDFHIASLPRSIYLCKSFTVMNLKMFKIMHALGHRIVSWDEEALVHLPPAMYYSRRLSPLSLQYVSHLFAWGEDNRELWLNYPEMPKDMPIHVTGNPRGDLLRPEMHRFYEDKADEIRKSFGKFILVNTNFNHVNAFFPKQNLFRPVKKPGEQPEFGKAAKGMSREFAQALRDYKQTVFEEFQRLIPRLDNEFPDFNIVVRPHPTENQTVYHKIASECRRVKVTNEGNIVPWLMAAKALVHNGCTTGVEAYAMRVPAISYRVVLNEEIDNGFYFLPHQLSHQCFSFQELRDTLHRILEGKLGAAEGEERATLFRHYVAAQDGLLACERIIGVVEDITSDFKSLPRPGLKNQFSGQLASNTRRVVKWLRSYFPGSHAPPEFHQHRYPGVTEDELRFLITRFQDVIGDHTKIRTEKIFDQVFRISPI